MTPHTHNTRCLMKSLQSERVPSAFGDEASCVKTSPLVCPLHTMQQQKTENGRHNLKSRSESQDPKLIMFLGHIFNFSNGGRRRVASYQGPHAKSNRKYTSNFEYTVLKSTTIHGATTEIMLYTPNWVCAGPIPPALHSWARHQTKTTRRGNNYCEQNRDI